MEKESRNYRNSQLKHCLLKGVLTQSKFQPFFLVTCYKSALVKRNTSVAKLSPEIVFWMELVSLSTIKSRSMGLFVFTR
jgi:hypothetical protein